ncbi:[citrate (pro-3S)-lyase] ligase [Oceanirhabdus sp. W0125-5]|uniref:[citrate (pro-3S)-lyase] ligase n=1 Tax=Oceanirhabdus sp. W0125-5 TaxID=2999116 RepID=UPI0022F31935|nr:[citrate (pro-3S)-lyase] ligase [Oceanirhabdus sp. W0125-5]WBW98042.1 [citrate (pro-3S)-lyase] ligase [Oceanirhabdus sp. W0125-5]
MYDFVIEEINISNVNQLDDVKKFLKNFDLEFEENIDCTIVIKQGGKIVGTCSKSGNILKCFAIDSSMRGMGLSSKLVTWMNNKLFDQGVYHSFIFTKPENINIFTGVGYKLIQKVKEVALLETGVENINKHIKRIIEKYDLKNNKKAALVMNCNPFTWGHRYLIEKASLENEEVIIFIVEEDRSLFPFKYRYELVKQGVADLKNVKVVPGGEYIISSATFPNYFLRKKDDVLRIFTELDASIFGEYFCNELSINKRYVGEEPFCEVTQAYNETLSDTLEKYGVELEIVKRREFKGKAISASQVREVIKGGEISYLKNLVPDVTMKFLLSSEGKEIMEKIKYSTSPH